VKGADLVCTTTSSREPVLQGAWLAAGAHVNAVGACFPNAREVDTEAVRRARLYTDCRESCLKEAGDFIIPRNEGAIDDGHLVGEVGDVFLGRSRGDGHRMRSRSTNRSESRWRILRPRTPSIAARGKRERETWLEWGGPP
jgi:ornithine cyclodeaminase/alanine dehydrogenase-like protein (mu-crystallin family)